MRWDRKRRQKREYKNSGRKGTVSGKEQWAERNSGRKETVGGKEQ